MIRRTLVLLACITLAGCATYGYRGGSGDYYYGSPTTTYRHYGAPYGSVGYGSGAGWYGGAGVGLPHYRYNSWNRAPYGYGYGGGYYRPPPVIVRPVYPGRPGHGRPSHGGNRPDRPGWGHGRPDRRPDRPGVGRPDRPGWGSGRPDRPGVGRPGGSRPGHSGRPPRTEGQPRPSPRPGFQRPPQAAPVSRPPPARSETRQSPRGQTRTAVTHREVEPI